MKNAITTLWSSDKQQFYEHERPPTVHGWIQTFTLQFGTVGYKTVENE